MSQSSNLLGELKKAERDNNRSGVCKLCSALDEMDEAESSGVIHVLLVRSIGINKLADILNRHGYPVGKRSILRHINEGHSQ